MWVETEDIGVGRTQIRGDAILEKFPIYTKSRISKEWNINPLHQSECDVQEIFPWKSIFHRFSFLRPIHHHSPEFNSFLGHGSGCRKQRIFSKNDNWKKFSIFPELFDCGKNGGGNLENSVWVSNEPPCNAKLCFRNGGVNGSDFPAP